MWKHHKSLRKNCQYVNGVIYVKMKKNNEIIKKWKNQLTVEGFKSVIWHKKSVIWHMKSVIWHKKTTPRNNFMQMTDDQCDYKLHKIFLFFSPLILHSSELNYSEREFE